MTTINANCEQEWLEDTLTREYLGQACKPPEWELTVPSTETRGETSKGSKECIFDLVSVTFENRRFELTREIRVNIQEEKDGYYIAECSELQLYGCANTLGQAINEIMEEFVVTYDGLVGEDDGKLTNDARQLRDKIAALVLRITCLMKEDWEETIHFSPIPLLYGFDQDD